MTIVLEGLAEMSDPSGNTPPQASSSHEESPSTSVAQITPDRLRTTPRSAVHAFGLRRPLRQKRAARQLFLTNEEERRLEENIELGSFDEPKPPPRIIPSDPKEHLYTEISIGTGEYTKSVEQDLEVLKEYGFIIDLEKGFLGNGFYGKVFKGIYGKNVTKNYIFFQFLKLIHLIHSNIG